MVSMEEVTRMMGEVQRLADERFAAGMRSADERQASLMLQMQNLWTQAQGTAVPVDGRASTRSSHKLLQVRDWNVKSFEGKAADWTEWAFEFRSAVRSSCAPALE